MSQMRLIIGNKNYSSWSLRPWIAMSATGIAFEEVLLPLYDDRWPDAVAAVSPTLKVPVLQDGDHAVWESLAILEYLADTRPDAMLWPADRMARALARAISSEMHAGFPALRGALPMNCRKRIPNVTLTTDVEDDIARIVRIWQDCRSRYGGGGDFLFGTFSNADAMFAPVVSRFATYDVALPAVARKYTEAVLDLPAMKRWYADARTEPWSLPHVEKIPAA